MANPTAKAPKPILALMCFSAPLVNCPDSPIRLEVPEHCGVFKSIKLMLSPFFWMVIELAVADVEDS
jgi:hypothetical protein